MKRRGAENTFDNIPIRRYRSSLGSGTDRQATFLALGPLRSYRSSRDSRPTAPDALAVFPGGFLYQFQRPLDVRLGRMNVADRDPEGITPTHPGVR